MAFRGDMTLFKGWLKSFVWLNPYLVVVGIKLVGQELFRERCLFTSDRVDCSFDVLCRFYEAWILLNKQRLGDNVYIGSKFTSKSGFRTAATASPYGTTLAATRYVLPATEVTVLYCSIDGDPNRVLNDPVISHISSKAKNGLGTQSLILTSAKDSCTETKNDKKESVLHSANYNWPNFKMHYCA